MCLVDPDFFSVRLWASSMYSLIVMFFSNGLVLETNFLVDMNAEVVQLFVSYMHQGLELWPHPRDQLHPAAAPEWVLVQGRPCWTDRQGKLLHDLGFTLKLTSHC